MAGPWRVAFLGTMVLGLGACDGNEPAQAPGWAPESSRTSERPEGDLPIRHALSRASSEMDLFRRTAALMLSRQSMPPDRFEKIEARIADVRSGLAGLTRGPEAAPTRGYEESAREAADIEYALEVLKLTSLSTVEDFARQARLDLYVTESDIRRLSGEVTQARVVPTASTARVDESQLRARLTDLRRDLEEFDGTSFESQRRQLAEAIGRLRRDVRTIQLLQAAGPTS
jgi:hypothetical protein